MLWSVCAAQKDWRRLCRNKIYPIKLLAALPFEENSHCCCRYKAFSTPLTEIRTSYSPCCWCSYRAFSTRLAGHYPRAAVPPVGADIKPSALPFISRLMNRTNLKSHLKRCLEQLWSVSLAKRYVAS